ncbi:MAG: hypothetical protein PVJ15_04265 [Gammaproteobacteria bacterium]|jgi:hypothetical protein
MAESSNQDGVVQALVERFDKIRLPVALQLREKVDRGELLNDMDIAFLEEVLSDSRLIKPLVDAHPEWQDIAARMAQLYREITEKALENEKQSGSRG